MPAHPRKQDAEGRFFCNGCQQWLDREAFDSLSIHAKRSYHGIQFRCRECQRRSRIERQSRLDYALGELVRRAGRRGRDLTITKEWAVDQWARQNGLCFYTDLPMTTGHGNGRVWSNVSIDRIDSEGAYTPENCVLCCTGFNLMKTDLPLDTLDLLCRAYLAKRT